MTTLVKLTLACISMVYNHVLTIVQTKGNNMRKITLETQKALESNYSMKSGNTEVRVTEGETSLLLHGNKIAMKNTETEATFFCLCGWNTPTTRERLQAAGIRVSQRGYQPVTLQSVVDSKGNTLAADSIINSTEIYEVVTI